MSWEDNAMWLWPFNYSAWCKFSDITMSKLCCTEYNQNLFLISSYWCPVHYSFKRQMVEWGVLCWSLASYPIYRVYNFTSNKIYLEILHNPELGTETACDLLNYPRHLQNWDIKKKTCNRKKSALMPCMNVEGPICMRTCTQIRSSCV